MVEQHPWWRGGNRGSVRGVVARRCCRRAEAGKALLWRRWAGCVAPMRCRSQGARRRGLVLRWADHGHPGRLRSAPGYRWASPIPSANAAPTRTIRAAKGDIRRPKDCPALEAETRRARVSRNTDLGARSSTRAHRCGADDVVGRQGREREKLDRVDLDREAVTRIAPARSALARCQSRTDTVMSPDATPSRKSGLNITRRA